MSQENLPKSFFELIKTHDLPVLVDFWAEWCGPCRMVAPVLKELSTEWKNKVTIIKINTDEKPQIAGNYGISSIPTLILFKKGEEVKRVSGALPIQQMRSTFGPYLD
jgi:thioredoxin